MKTIQKSIMVCLIVLLAGFQSDPIQNNDVRKVQETIQTFFNGIGALDYDAIRNVCTKNFLLFENGEKMSCEDFINLLKQYEAMGASDFQYQFENMNVSVQGNHATVNLETLADGIIGGQNVKFHWLESAVLDKAGDQWKIAFYHSTEKAQPKSDEATKLTDEQKEKIINEVDQAFNHFIQATINKDLEACKNCIELHDDLVNAADGQISKGGEKMVHHLEEAFASFEKFENVNFSEKTIYVLSADAAILSSLFEEDIHLKTKEKMYVKGSYMYVYKKIKDQWKVVSMAGSHIYN